MADDLLSIVIITYNSAREITPCLESVYADLGQRPAELIAVDSASIDSTIAIIRANFPHVLIRALP